MHFPVHPILLSLAVSWWRKSGHTTAAGLLKIHALLFHLFIPLTLDRAPLHGTILGGGCLDCWAVQPVMTGLTDIWMVLVQSTRGDKNQLELFLILYTWTFSVECSPTLPQTSLNYELQRIGAVFQIPLAHNLIWMHGDFNVFHFLQQPGFIAQDHLA